MIHRLKWTLMCTALACTSLHAALFEDEEARRAILDLRQKVDLIQQRNADQLRKLTEDNAQANEQTSSQLTQLRKSMLELSNLIESLRSELAAVRGQGEQLARELAEVQRRQKRHCAGHRRPAQKV